MLPSNAPCLVNLPSLSTSRVLDGSTSHVNMSHRHKLTSVFSQESRTWPIIEQLWKAVPLSATPVTLWKEDFFQPECIVLN